MEILSFKELQQNFIAEYADAFPDKMAAKTVIIIPGITLDQSILSKVKGIIHYEERMLCLFMLLRMPNTHIIYVTSVPIDPVIVDYYLHMLPGITGYHARQRLTLLSCFDASRKSLTDKILERPKLIERIRRSIPAGHLTHLSCFNVTGAEKKLAELLQKPVFGCDPDLIHLGTKSNSRKIFRACGIDTPEGYEDLYTESDIVDALINLKKQNRGLRKAVVKINDGFSGEGNAVFCYDGAPAGKLVGPWIKEVLQERLQIVADNVSYLYFIEKFKEMGGIVEAFIEGYPKYSPSVQCRINPLGNIETISTHDQILSGENGQVFIGATFPAQKEYAYEIAKQAEKVSLQLKEYGVIGRYSIDFISIKDKDDWKHYAIEINLRKGGTTHPFTMLQFLTDGKYDVDKGTYYTANGQPRYYVCTDNLQSDRYKGLTPYDLIEIMTQTPLLFNGSTQEGVMFHIISALSQYGKLGLVCIGATAERASEYYKETVNVLDKETNIKTVTAEKEIENIFIGNKAKVSETVPQ